jgi:hypothetical protein
MTVVTSTASQGHSWPSPTSRPPPDVGAEARPDLDPRSGRGVRRLPPWQLRPVELGEETIRARVKVLTWPAGENPAGVGDQQATVGPHLGRSRIERQQRADVDVITTRITLPRAAGSSNKLLPWSVVDQTPTSSATTVDVVSINGVSAGSIRAPRQARANVPVEACTLVHVLTPRRLRNVDN